MTAPASTAATDDVAAAVVVIRLVRKRPTFIPPGSRANLSDAFVPSTGDKDEAAARGKPVRVSVWDLALTSIEEARVFFGDEDSLPFSLQVECVVKAAHKLGQSRLRVVRDPLADPRPGSAGHCGIEGLDREPKTPRPQHKALLDEVALCAKPWT
jgi:hypothetical protein